MSVRSCAEGTLIRARSASANGEVAKSPSHQVTKWARDERAFPVPTRPADTISTHRGDTPRLCSDVDHRGATLRRGNRGPTLRVACACSAALVLAAVGGCTAGGVGLEETAKPKPERRPVSFAIHLAYDEAQPGCEKMTSRRGETVYVAPRVELDRADLEIARALHSENRSMLQLVFNYTGRRALADLTRAQGWQSPMYTPPGQKSAVKAPPRLAVLIGGELVCAPYIDRAVGSGEIQIVDVFSWQESEDVAAGLNLRAMP
jgi:hypothetical protein